MNEQHGSPSTRPILETQRSFSRSSLLDLEERVLEKLLEGDMEQLAVLRRQLADVQVISREMTGAGFYLQLAVREHIAPLSPPANLHFGDVVADMAGLKYGLGFVLFIEEGRLRRLEGYSYGEEGWPMPLEKWNLRFDPPNRDLSALTSISRTET